LSAPRSRKGALLLGLLVAAVFLYLFARGRDWGAIGAHLRAARPGWLAVGLALQVLSYMLKTWRWSLLLPAPGAPRAARWDAIALGFGANIVLPGRVGEALRVAAIHRLGPTPVAHGVSSLVLERLMDLAAIGSLLGAGTLALGSTSGALAKLQWVGLAVAAATIAAPLVLYLLLGRAKDAEAREAWLDRLASWAPARIREGARGFLGGLAGGFAVVDGPGRLAQVYLLSLVHWLVIGASIWCAAAALGAALSAAGSLVVLGAVCFAAALPQAPGFVGPYQWAAGETLRVLGQPTDQAGALAIVAWLVGVVPALALGGVSLLRLGRGEVQELVAEEEALEEAAESAVEATFPGDDPKNPA